MATTAGVLSLVSVSSNSDSVLSAVATGGTAPYTYQWYRSTTSGFAPGGGNIIAGATALSLLDSGLIPGTQYYYKVIATDVGAVAGTSAQLSVLTTTLTPSQNQFALSSILGTLDLRQNTGTVSAMVSSAYAGVPIVAGQAVKLVASNAGGVPMVVPCTANSDAVYGFVNYSIKSIGFVANQAMEISLAGNVMWLYATGAITQGVQVTLDVTTIGGVGAKVGSSGAAIVGWAFDGAAAAGALIRVQFSSLPAFTFA